jgi:hypothetical protein
MQGNLQLSILMRLLLVNGSEFLRPKIPMPRSTLHSPGEDYRENAFNSIFAGLSGASEKHAMGGLMYGLGENRRVLGLAIRDYDGGEHNIRGLL